jgi:hypothetical protein
LASKFLKTTHEYPNDQLSKVPTVAFLIIANYLQNTDVLKLFEFVLPKPAPSSITEETFSFENIFNQKSNTQINKFQHKLGNILVKFLNFRSHTLISMQGPGNKLIHIFVNQDFKNIKFVQNEIWLLQENIIINPYPYKNTKKN